MALSYRLSEREKAGKSEILLSWKSAKTVNGRLVWIQGSAHSNIFVEKSWFDFVVGNKTRSPFAGKRGVMSDDMVDCEKYHRVCQTRLIELNGFVVSNVLNFSPTKGWLKDTVELFYQAGKYRKMTLLQFIDKYIAELPNKKINGKLMKISSIKDQSRVQRKITDFAKHLNRKDFDFEEIDNDFVNKYIDYLTVNCGHTKNNVGNCVKHLRTVLNAAFDAKLMPNKLKIRKLSEDIENIYLSEAELDSIQFLNLSQHRVLERNRDFFLLLAWTGCRVSDLPALLLSPIDNGYVALYQQKTETYVKIPIHPKIITLMEKYHGVHPKINSKFNGNIRTIAKLAGITNEVTISRTVGGERVTEHKEKSDLIGSHTARRSFATNMYLLGIPSITIMSVTGHRTEKSFMTYIKVKQSEHSAIMKRFFEKSIV
jgi:integrase